MSEKPFDNPYSDSTMVKNAVFDRIMPALSPNGWKVLCVAIRRTWGGVDPTATSGRKGEAQISHDQFMEATGIQEPEAITRATEECLHAGYLVRHEVGMEAQSDQPMYTYALNTEFEISVLETEREKQAVVALAPEKEAAFQALMDFGHEMEADPDAGWVQEIVTASDTDVVLVWIETGREMTNLEKPARFHTVVQRLLDKVPPLPATVLAQDTQWDARREREELAPTEPELETLTAQELWEATLEALQSQVRKSQLKWLKPTRGIEIAAGRLTVEVPNKRTKEWLEEGQLTDTVQQTLASVAGRPIELAAVVSE